VTMSNSVLNRSKTKRVSFRLTVIGLLLFAIQATPAIAQSSVELVGNDAYDIDFTTNTITLTVAEVLNNSSTYTTGTLRLEIWATTYDYAGGDITGNKIATFSLPGSGALTPDTSFDDLSGSAPLVDLPPPGTYFVSILVAEYAPSACVSTDGFCVDTYASFENPLVVPGSSGSPPSCTVSLNPTSLPATGGTVGYQAACSGSPTSYSWSVGQQNLSNATSSGSAVVSANTSQSILDYQFSVVASNAFGSSQVASAIVAQAAATSSSSINIGGYISGNWYDPTEGGQGFQIEAATNNNMVAIWFVYSPDGTSQNWIYAQGGYSTSSNTVTLPAILLTGARFPPNFNSSDVTQTSWGTITFTFTDCNDGTASWVSTLPGYGSGSLPISRLTQIDGTVCPQ